MSITGPAPNRVYTVVEYVVNENGDLNHYKGSQWRKIRKLVNTLENGEDGILETFGYEKGAISFVERVEDTLCYYTHDLENREETTLWERRRS